MSGDDHGAGLDLDAIEARANAATEGPWEVSQEIDGMRAGMWTTIRATQDGQRRRVVTVDQTRPHHSTTAEANIAHIAGMDPATTLALVAEVRRLRAQVNHPADDPECVTSPCQYHEVLAERDALQAALNFKRGVIDDLSATIQRLEDGVRF